MNTPDTVNSPDALKSDPDSMEFYILRDEKVVICRNRQDVPYWQNRSTYLSSGRYSPEYKKVVFWPDPINPSLALRLLKEEMHINEDYSYAVSGLGTRAPKPTKKNNPVDKLDGVRKRAVEVLLERGLRIQNELTEDNSKEKS